MRIKYLWRIELLSLAAFSLYASVSFFNQTSELENIKEITIATKAKMAASISALNAIAYPNSNYMKTKKCKPMRLNEEEPYLLQIANQNETMGALYLESRNSSRWHQKNLQFLFQHGKNLFNADKENLHAEIQ